MLVSSVEEDWRSVEVVWFCVSLWTLAFRRDSVPSSSECWVRIERDYLEDSDMAFEELLDLEKWIVGAKSSVTISVT